MKHPAILPTVTEGNHGDLSALVGVVKHALLRPAMACIFLGISRTGLHRLSEFDPTFPRKIVLSKRCVGYRAESLEAWLAAKESSL
jgi:prophage regulatory protein